ncbi:MFS transporter [Capsulimonas corticalis]|uniref:MFS transporter n=1 Tax=Capsulimonas corticalis TaxID=2219043 RepID=A0A402CTS1_9BACT|nr:MFS transporter [Capsulimonas corticalis]BDI30646.1 MFS transporter [Capsulimonas corticalis]
MLTLGLTTGVEFLENSMLVLSSAHVQGGVGATPEEFVWVTAAYATAAILMILLQQNLTEHFGYRRYLTASLIVYAAASLGCGFAHSVITLIAWRVVQGAGAGALFTSCRILIQFTFLGPERVKALRFFMAGVFGGSTLAPLLATRLIDASTWNWIFWIIVPIILACALLVWFTVPEPESAEKAEQQIERRVRYDYWPIALFAVSIVSVEIVMQRVRFQFLTQSPHLLLLLAVAILAIVGFVTHQLRVPDPILHLTGLRNKQFLWGLLFYFIYYLLAYAFSYLFPVFCEQVLLYSVDFMGRLLFFSGVVSMAGVMVYLGVSSRLRRRKLLMCAGMLSMAAAFWMLSRLSTQIAASGLYLPLFLRSLFAAMLVLPVAGLAFKEFELDFYSHAYRLKNIIRQLCQTFAVAAMTVMLHHRAAVHRFDLAGDADPSSAAVSQRISTLSHGLIAHGLGAADAHAAALALMGKALERQILLLSCLDAFTLLAGVALLGFALMALQRQLD